ncbi:MAG: menaquinone biosynthesis decarboxylase [Anaerolineales bacterium]|jgi:4-hydroxy-3-polyprenylbenzoate decarboxylase
MTTTDMRGFLELLEGRGHLTRVQTPVSRDLEITEIVDRVSKGPLERNKALLFEKVQGFSVPVAINLFGHPERMAWALGVGDLEELSEKLGALLDLRLPRGLGGLIERGSELLGVLGAIAPRPRLIGRAACQEVVEKEHPTLESLPVLKCWPEDAGRFITLPQVITRDPVTGARNVGLYRLQVVDERTLLVHWQRHKGGAEHEREARLIGADRIPAAVALGGDTAAMWCASAPLPPNIDEYLLAGWLRGKPIEMVSCVSQPLEVPAESEFVIEGYVDPQEHRLEGPFGDHTGYYTPSEPFPVFHVTAVTHRRDPIYPSSVVGPPPMEDAWMGKASERLFLPLMRLFLPEIVEVNMPAEGIFHNLVIVSIRKRYPGHARKVMYGLWGMGLMMLAKALVIVDETVDVHNLREVAWHALGDVDWKADVEIVEGPLDHLDHAAVLHSYGGKIGIDATAKGLEEGHSRAWPRIVEMSPEVRRRIDQLWNDLGL